MIRPHHDRDTPAMLDLWYAASRIAMPFLWEEFLARERREIQEVWLPKADTWVYDDGVAVAGFIALVGDEVGGIFVHPDRQSAGIGRTLMDHALALRGSLALDVFRENRVGRSFYERYGFREVDRHVHNVTGRVELRLMVDRPASWGQGSVDRYLIRVAAHQVDGALALLSPDFSLSFPKTPMPMDRNGTARALAWHAGADGRLAWRVIERSESRVRVEGREGNEFLDLVGVGGIDFRSIYTLGRDDLIEGQECDADWAGRDLDKAMAPLLEWASQRAPEELSELRPDGRMIRSGATVRQWVALARRWREEEGPA